MAARRQYGATTDVFGFLQRNPNILFNSSQIARELSNKWTKEQVAKALSNMKNSPMSPIVPGMAGFYRYDPSYFSNQPQQLLDTEDSAAMQNGKKPDSSSVAESPVDSFFKEGVRLEIGRFVVLNVSETGNNMTLMDPEGDLWEASRKSIKHNV